MRWRLWVGGFGRPEDWPSSSPGFDLESRFVSVPRVCGGALSGDERLHLWQAVGSGRASKLRVVVKNAPSQVPAKPLGLYNPSFDKDSCGVGFVAELSSESSRKTVMDAIEMLVRNFE